MATAYLSLGSNLGRQEANIASALGMLEQEAWVLKVSSSLYETEPMGYKDQPWFLNLVCAVETDLPPQALLKLAKTIEKTGPKIDCPFRPPSYRYRYPLL